MRTACSSSRQGGGVWSPSISPLGVGLDLIPLNFPLGCGPGPDPPQFLAWVWAWIWSPSISPLGVGLGPPWEQTPPRSRHPPPVNRMTDACENITLSQTSFAGGNKNVCYFLFPYRRFVWIGQSKDILVKHSTALCIREGDRVC